MSDMTQTEAGTGKRVSEARERLLRTAGQLFYTEGIHTVGVDRLVAEAKVTNATFYRHFRSKEDLAVAYIGSVDQAIRTQIGALMAADAPTDGILRGIGASLVEQIRSPGYADAPSSTRQQNSPPPTIRSTGPSYSTASGSCRRSPDCSPRSRTRPPSTPGGTSSCSATAR